MFSKIIVSIGIAFMLSGGVARAAPNDAESTVPDSVDFPNRMVDRHAPSNEAIDALESGNPNSVLYRERMIDTTEISAMGWRTLESGDPNVR
jgi:hypothetical protein